VARRRRLLLALSWLGALGSVALAGAAVAGGAGARPASCSQSRPLPPGHREDLPYLTAPDGGIVMHFGDSRSQGVGSVVLSADGEPLLPGDFASRHGLAVQLGDSYIRRDGDHWIALGEGDGFAAKLIPVGPRKLELCVLVQPKAIGGLAPGRYRGTMLVVMGNEQTRLASLPVELTFRASHWTALETVVVAVLLGLLVKLLSDAAAVQREARLGPLQALASTVKDLGFPAAIVLAVVGSWLVFSQVYGGNPAWGGSGEDVAKLFAVCFLAQMSSNQGIDVIRRVGGGNSGGGTGP